MEYLSKKVSYLKGFADGLEIDETSNEGKLLAKIIDVLDDMAVVLDDVSNAQDELEEKVEAIDEELSDMVTDFFDDSDYEYDEKDELDDLDKDDDFENDDIDYFEIQCPNCKDDVLIDYDMINDENSIVCPNCNQEIELVFDCDCDDEDCDCSEHE